MVDILTRKKQAHTAGASCSVEYIYHQYHKNVYNYIAFRINNHHDAEELASEVFIKAIKGWERYNHNFPMEGWLIGIAKNVVADYLRKTMRRKILPLDSVLGLASTHTPEEVVVINEESKKLMMAMVKLRDKERQILSMKFATELKHSEIAAILRISESHVGVTAHRAINKLKKFMEEDAT